MLYPILIRTSRGPTPYPFITCSETLYFLFKVSRKRVIKYKAQGIYIIDRQRKGGVLGKEENRRKNRCFNKHSTRLRVSLLFDCKILKPITQQAIYISNFIRPILLVLRTRRWWWWGDTEEGLNKKPLFTQRCLQTFFIFLSRSPRSFSHARRCSVFEKN